jgi:hypothetical protein
VDDHGRRPFLFLCYVLAYMDRVNVGFAKLQMASDLGMSHAAFAAGASVARSPRCPSVTPPRR